MKVCRRKYAGFLVLLLGCGLDATENDDRQKLKVKGRVRDREQNLKDEADEDAEYAAIMLGALHNKVRDVGDLLRLIGDTTGAMAGGGMKAIGATVNGLSAVLDAASKSVDGGEQLEPSTEGSDRHSHRPPGRSPDGSHVEGQRSAGTSAVEHGSRSDKDTERPPSADPLGRLVVVTRDSLAGSLRLVSTAIRGMGDVVCQAGDVAEGLAGGTGQVAEGLVRVVQDVLVAARDDMEKFSGVAESSSLEDTSETDESLGGSNMSGNLAGVAMTSAAASPGQEGPNDNVEHSESVWTTRVIGAAVGWTAGVALETARVLWCLVNVASRSILLEALTLTERRRGGAVPPAQHMALLMALVLFVWVRRGRPPPATRAVSGPGDTQPPPTEQLGHESCTGLIANPNVECPEAMICPESRSLSPLPPLQEPGPQSSELTSRSTDAPGSGASERMPEEGSSSPGQRNPKASDEVKRWHVIPSRWRINQLWRRRSSGATGGPGREQGQRAGWRHWFWLVVLWLGASAVEERERQRVAWLAWDAGFRGGRESRMSGPGSKAETLAWLNHLIGNMWGGHGSSVLKAFGVCQPINGLGSHVSEIVAETILDALEELKPNSVVDVELQEVYLGTVAPQILGVEVLSPMSGSLPRRDDDTENTCRGAGECVSFRVEVEAATQDLRVGFGVKLWNLERVLLPTGSVRLLELYFRASVVIRIDVRHDYPFLGLALVSFDGIPEVLVRMEQWGLDALTVGVVDEWVRIELQRALKPFVLPGFMEVDAAQVICPECSSSKTGSGSSGASVLRAHAGVDNPSTNVPPTVLSSPSLSASSSVHSFNRASPPILTEPLHAPRLIEVKSTAAEMASEDGHWRADLDAGRLGSCCMGERRRRRPWGKPNEVPLAAVGTPASATALSIEPSRSKEHSGANQPRRQVSAQVPAASPLLHESDSGLEEGEGGLFGIVGADPAPGQRLHKGHLGRVVRWIKKEFARRDRVEWEVMDF